jgi:hypothetical protein
MTSLTGQRGYFPNRQTIFFSPDQSQDPSNNHRQGLIPIKGSTPKPITPSIVQPVTTDKLEVVKPFPTIQHNSRQNKKASTSETPILWHEQAGILLKQYGPSLMKQFGPSLARKVGMPLAQQFGPPLARNVGIPLARRIANPLVRRLFVPLAKRAGFALIRRLGFPF